MVVKIMVLFLGTLHIRCRIIIRTQKGAIILTSTHVWAVVYGLSGESYKLSTDECSDLGCNGWGIVSSYHDIRTFRHHLPNHLAFSITRSEVKRLANHERLMICGVGLISPNNPQSFPSVGLQRPPKNISIDGSL